MKLKTAKIVMVFFVCLLSVIIILYALTWNPICCYVGLAVLFAAAVFWIIFGRCPSCGRTLWRGQASAKYCPHCGEKIK